MPPRTPSLFANLPPSPPLSEIITAHCDGGARGNPGPAGYGVEITDSTGAVVAELSEFLGIRTNNFAEYSGLLASLQYALDHSHRSLRVISDSELMVKQIQGKYKVNSPDLKLLWSEAKSRIAKLDRFEITHALRHKNKQADRLANEAMDRGMKRGTPASARAPVDSARGPVDPVRPVVSTGTPQSQSHSQGGVQSLPLRAIPYPQTSAAPPPPAVMDPKPRPEPIISRPDPPVRPAPPPTPRSIPAQPSPQISSSRPESQRSGDAVERPCIQIPPNPTGAPTNLPPCSEVLHAMASSTSSATTPFPTEPS